jgi:hypothetical protein
MDIYDKIAAQLGLDEMEIDKAPVTAPAQPRLQLLEERKKSFTLDCGYHGFENAHPWPSFVQLLPNHKLLVNFNRWPIADDVPNISAGRGVFPFRWSDKRISEQMKSPETVQKLGNFIATRPLVTSIEYTPTLYLLLNGVELNAPISPKHEQPITMLSTDIVLFYLQVLHIMQDNVDENGKRLDENARCIENFNTMSETQIVQFHKLVTDDNSLVRLAHALLANPDIEALTQPQRDDLLRFARLLEIFNINFIRLLEALVFSLSPFHELSVEHPRFKQFHGPRCLTKGGLPVEFGDAFNEQEFLGNQLAFLKCKFEQQKIPFPEVTLTMQQCYRGLNMQACALFLYFMFVNTES